MGRHEQKNLTRKQENFGHWCSVVFERAVATIVYANAGLPPELRQITSKLFDKKVFGYWNSAGGKIKIQISDTAQNPELIVPDVSDEKKPSDEE